MYVYMNCKLSLVFILVNGFKNVIYVYVYVYVFG